MIDIFKKLGITEYEVTDEGFEAELLDSNDFGRVYSHLEKNYEIDEEISSVDSVVFDVDGLRVNIIADYTRDSYILRVIKEEV